MYKKKLTISEPNGNENVNYFGARTKHLQTTPHNVNDIIKIRMGKDP